MEKAVRKEIAKPSTEDGAVSEVEPKVAVQGATFCLALPASRWDGRRVGNL